MYPKQIFLTIKEYNIDSNSTITQTDDDTYQKKSKKGGN